jgi:hypothetical protein
MPAADRLLETERRRRAGQVDAEDVYVLGFVLRGGGVVAAAYVNHARVHPWRGVTNCFMYTFTDSPRHGKSKIN